MLYIEFVTLAFAVLFIESSQQACKDNTLMCTFRYELQFDFENTFNKNCTDVAKSFICLTRMKLVYYEFEPYVAFDNETQSPNGLIQVKLIVI